jgi:hypothetical protein
MTYKELLSQLQSLTEDQLNQDVVICDSGFDDLPMYYQSGVELVSAPYDSDVFGLDQLIIRF